MVESLTVARPYAKAIFDFAKSNKMLDDWDEILSYLSIIINDEKINKFIKNKTLSYLDKSKNLCDGIVLLNTFNDNIKNLYINFINLLAYYGRLSFINDIYFLYKQYMNFELNRIETIIKTAIPINNIQKDYIIEILSKKFNKNIFSLFEIEEKLLGGFVIKINDFVLDASISGNLHSLRTKILS